MADLNDIKVLEESISEELLNRYHSQQKPNNLLCEWFLSKSCNILLQLWRGVNGCYFVVSRVYLDKSSNRFQFHATSLSKRQLLVLGDLVDTAVQTLEKLERGE
jgi:hypothetical protein